MLSSDNAKLLKQNGLLDNKGHPTIGAYERAINTVSSDVCPLCIELWKHANECEICSKRANEALEKIYS